MDKSTDFESYRQRYLGVPSSLAKNLDLDDMQLFAKSHKIDDKIMETAYNELNPGESRGEYFIGEAIYVSLI